MDAATLAGPNPAFEPHLTLLRAGEVLTFAALREPCRLTPGSSTACDLRVSARGVRPKHLEVAWDGLRLTVVWAVAPDAVRRQGVAVAVPFIVAASTTLELGEDLLLCLELGEAPPDDAPTRVMPALASTTLASVPEPGRLAAACNRAREAVASRKRAGGTRPGPLHRRAAILVATAFILGGLALLVALASRGAAARSVPVPHPYPHFR